MKILVIGAAGSGTSTLGRALGARLACRHLDLDDYFWVPTTPPYQQKREAGDRLQALLRDLHATQNVIASGSLVAWGVTRKTRSISSSFSTFPPPCGSSAYGNVRWSASDSLTLRF